MQIAKTHIKQGFQFLLYNGAAEEDTGLTGRQIHHLGNVQGHGTLPIPHVTFQGVR